MWEPFTERARKTIVLAQEEAAKLGNNYIGTEHLLLGIISEGESVAAKVLHNMGVSCDNVREKVISIAGKGAKASSYIEIVFTPRAKRIIELAFEEARHLGHNYIGTEHLLLALVKEGEGVAARVLMDLGVELSKIYDELSKLLGVDFPGTEKQRNQTPETRRRVSPSRGLPIEGREQLEIAVILNRAFGEAKNLNHDCISSGHIFLGILSDEDNAVSGAFKDLGVDLDKVREEVIRLLKEKEQT